MSVWSMPIRTDKSGTVTFTTVGKSIQTENKGSAADQISSTGADFCDGSGEG